MPLPHVRIIRRQVEEALPIIKGLPMLYRVASQMAYERIQTEEVKGRSTGHGNPTKNLALDRKAMERRNQIEIGLKELDQLCSLARSIAARFNNLPDQKSLQSAPEKDSAVGPGYVKEQRERQARRIANADKGPMWSESAEVR